MVTGLFAEKTATYLCSSENDFCLELLTVDQQENKSLLNLGFFHIFKRSITFIKFLDKCRLSSAL